MSNQNKMQKFQQQIWYIIINNQTRGPLSLRDLDVLLRTSEINSSTYAWKNGMKQWKLMNQIQQIKQSILQSSKQIFQIQKKKGQIQSKTDDKKQNNQNNQDQIIQNKDQDVLDILQATVANLLQKTFQQTEDGKWNIYDEEKQQWIQQSQQPTEQMEKMKKNLFNKLKSSLFFQQKSTFKRNNKKPIKQKQQEQRQLTKQQLARKQKNRKKTKRAAQKKKQKWYQAKMNTFIYITGLPMDITQNQLKQFCSKAGVIRIDLNTGNQKIKIYKDQTNIPKGDAVVSYARVQSVQIALEMLNGAEIRTGFVVNVQRAEFQQKAEQYIPRQTKKESKIQKIKAKRLQNKLFGWNEQDEQTSQGLRIIVIKNVFSTEIIQNQDLIQKLKQQIKTQLNKFGQIQRIRYFETHPQGVVQVKFKLEKDAENCVENLDKKIFHGRQLQCEYWDGQTDYKNNAVSLLLQDERLNKFASELQNNITQKQSQS